MRIGLNGLFLKQPMTGSGQYTKNLLAALAEIDQSNDYLLITPPQGGDRARMRAAANSATSFVAPMALGFRYREVKTPFDAFSRQLSKVWFEQIGVPNAGRREQVDVIHYPYFAAPLFSHPKVVVTIHDVIPLLQGPYRGSASVQLYTKLVSTAAKRAAAIITDSESSKSDIVRILGIPSEKIAVVYLAVDAGFRMEDNGDALRQVRRRYGLGEDFVLYIGGLDYRKNVISLVEAFAEVRRRLGAGIKLAIAGHLAKESALFPDVRGAVHKLGIEDAVVFLGPVADNDRPLLYSAAKVFVFPSLYEGFGLPPLEAMACGAPVICSNSSSLPEVVGDAAIVFEPTRRDELVLAMLDVLTKEDLRAKLRGKGLRRAGEFSWAKTAQETLMVYEAVEKGCGTCES